MPAPRTVTRLSAAAALTLGLTLAGCGGDDSAGSTAGPSAGSTADAGSSAAGSGTPSSTPSSSSGGAGPATTAPNDPAAATLTATEADFSIALSSDSLPAGTYTITVDNEGSATHSLKIEGPGGVEQTSDTLQGGQSTTMTVTLQPGQYEVYCPIGNHRAMGMDTTLTVS